MSSVAAGAPGTTAARKPAPRSARRRLGAVLQGVALALGLVLMIGGTALIGVSYHFFKVPTGSMRPGIDPGDTLAGRPVSGSSVGRGDVVVFQDTAWEQDTLVKRVVGVGGDTVVCCDAQQRITVNGTPIDEPYLAPAGLAPPIPFNVTVPAGRLFVLGDNRTGSQDSRVHLGLASGTVPDSAVQARVEATVWPPSRIGMHAPTTAFATLGRPTAGRPGSLETEFWAAVAGAALILLTSLIGSVAGLARRIAGRR
ncbi:signal peptidase I [Kitasatospora sp. GP30]|uniref:signal peptidase I n=1 Tax=Kitasatospora sp. GP30 TaxID=3035084 RepID=UPI000C705EDB|nr:signal peptidase I [Kitasatospora sp. GP30]MDH6144708.1 signal peptidase I [Kitasatospora sp. GP30]